MKKSLIALALMGAFSGAALAQSNVTLYGILDVNLQRNDPNGNQSATTGVNSGHQSGSRWGLRGSEALGGGLNAIFTIEGGYGVDDGQLGQGGRLWGRQAWAGLSGGFGSVVLGRLATFSSGTGSFDMFGATDPFLTGFGDSSLGSTFTSAGALRIDNVIAYVSPSWGGFKFGAGYSFNIAGQEGAGSSANNTGVILGANFSRGPFFASVTYDIIDPACTTASCPSDDQTHLQLGATFDLKFLKIHAGYAIEENIRTIGTANSTAFGTGAVVPAGFRGRDADAWMVGLSVPLAGGTLMASYQDRDADSVTFGTVTTDPDLTVYAIAYSYPLSRRTNLYANWSNRDGGGTNANNATWDRKQYTVGVRHLF
jgi:general bacterial porin, GBP family